MSITSVFRRLLSLQGTRVLGVEFFPTAMMICVDVSPTRRNPTCSRCGRRHAVGTYDSERRIWRHVDLGPWEIYLRYRIRRFLCPHCKAVVTEIVPWAEFASAFSRDFEDVASFLAQQTTQATVSRTLKIAWPTVGNIVRRTVARRGPARIGRLYRIGVDEISYRKHHKYLSIIADHDTGHVVWAGNGKSGDSLDPFLDSLGDEGRRAIQLVSMDMSQAYISKVTARLPHAVIVFDPFHVVKLANDAVDKVRRQQVRALRDKAGPAQALKKTRWVLLKTPEDLLPSEVERLGVLAKINGPLYRAYLLKEALRAVFREPPVMAPRRLEAWLKWASRSRLPSFVSLARTIRQHRAGILAAIEHGLSNGRLEGLNNKIRLISHRAYGFHSAEALIALVMLCCSGIDVPLPADQRPGSDPYAIM